VPIRRGPIMYVDHDKPFDGDDGAQALRLREALG
jgi:hypothetical protein